MKSSPLPRLDKNLDLREQLLPFCRLKSGEIWEDPEGKHRVMCADATKKEHVQALFDGQLAVLAVQDPPYNVAALQKRSTAEYIDWCRLWLQHTSEILTPTAALYVWLGANQQDHFSPLPEFMLLMRELPFQSRSMITMRNQRGYGTQHNWMAVRQELLYYTRGKPDFEVQYTDIPKILRGYYKEHDGRRSENLERSRSSCLRASNVWVDIQQVFYRLQENVSGCYVQKPLKSIERILLASSREGDLLCDFFSHSGTTLLAAERLNRRCFTMDIDPIYCEISIRRLEYFRDSGETGWQNQNAFGWEQEPEHALEK